MSDAEPDFEWLADDVREEVTVAEEHLRGDADFDSATRAIQRAKWSLQELLGIAAVKVSIQWDGREGTRHVHRDVVTGEDLRRALTLGGDHDLYVRIDEPIGDNEPVVLDDGVELKVEGPE